MGQNREGTKEQLRNTLDLNCWGIGVATLSGMQYFLFEPGKRVNVRVDDSEFAQSFDYVKGDVDLSW